MNRAERRNLILYGVLWLVVLVPALGWLCTALRPDTSTLPGAVLYIVMQVLTFAAWIALAPIGGTPLTRWRLRRRMSWRQLIELHAGRLPMDVRCEAQLVPYEQCFYATGARRVYAANKVYDPNPLYGTLLLTNLRVIFVQQWRGAEFLLSEVRSCKATARSIEVQTVNNYTFLVQHPRAVVNMIERMRLSGDSIVQDMIYDAAREPVGDPDKPIKVKL